MDDQVIDGRKPVLYVHDFISAVSRGLNNFIRGITDAFTDSAYRQYVQQCLEFQKQQIRSML